MKELQWLLSACSGNADLEWRPFTLCDVRCGRQLHPLSVVDDALMNGGIPYAIQALTAYYRMEANLHVVLFGDFSSKQDTYFINLVAAMRRARFLQILPFDQDKVCQREKWPEDDPSNTVVMRHDLLEAHGLSKFGLAVIDAMRHGVVIGSINADKPTFERMHHYLPVVLRATLIPLADLPSLDGRSEGCSEGCSVGCSESCLRQSLGY